MELRPKTVRRELKAEWKPLLYIRIQQLSPASVPGAVKTVKKKKKLGLSRFGYVSGLCRCEVFGLSSSGNTKTEARLKLREEFCSESLLDEYRPKI